MIPCVFSTGPLTRCRHRLGARTVADMAASNYPMLPGPYSLSRYGGGGGLDGYRERAARVFGQGMGGVRSFGANTGRQLAGVYGALGRAGKEDTLGGVVASVAGAGAATFAFGALDRTEMGMAMYEATGKWLKPSTAIAVVVGLMRGLGIDRRWAPKAIVSANTAILRGIIPVWLYGAGERTKDAVSSRLSGGSPQLSGPPASISGAQEQPAEIEPIPGEETQS